MTPGSGAFTTVSAAGGYQVIGKFVYFCVTITITAKGTASETMSIPLPTGTAKRAASVLATETAVIGCMGFGRIASGGSSVSVILKYDNTTYIGNGHVVTIIGFYEQN
ncbi:hypothetical protein [Bradyrhizobium sp. BR 1432]|uniref:hypothetical protein n=1 Tax=Bradyrhizobium sp. BR 1432 TaxID=3447966 RepID=UPI003EE4FF93